MIDVKKKLLTHVGRIELDTNHPFSSKAKGVKCSPKMKEMVSYVAKDQCYQEASRTIEKCTGLVVDDNTVYRITQEVANIAKEILEERSLEDESEVLYAGMDGTMVLTRSDGWKEVKVARVFSASSIEYDEENSDKRSTIGESEYLTHFGKSDEFGVKLQRLLGPQRTRGEDLVFLVDGAIWMKKWIDRSYPEATQILDYYHVSSHLSEFTNQVISKKDRRSYYDDLREKLLHKGGQSLVNYLNTSCSPKIKEKEAYSHLIRYLENNSDRMDYPEYEKRGLYIGSGSIESAHRTVIHKRLKLSGQRWKINGAQRVMNLRELYLSDKWNLLPERMVA